MQGVDAGITTRRQRYGNMKIPIELAIDLLHLATDGTLATHSETVPGYPFATAVPHVPDEAHRPVFCISRLAEHTRNILADTRVSYALTQPGAADVQTAPRMTMVGDVEPLEPSSAFIERFLRYFPAAEPLLALDFSFFRLTPRRVRYIGGVGKMGWLEAADWHTLATLTPGEEQLVLRELVASQGRRPRLLGVDRYGMDIEIGEQRQRHRFPNGPLATQDIETTIRRMFLALP